MCFLEIMFWWSVFGGIGYYHFIIRNMRCNKKKIRKRDIAKSLPFGMLAIFSIIMTKILQGLYHDSSN